jgi:SHS2 domain-containing protein
MGYVFLDDIVTADIAFRAEGGTLEELFLSASDALFEVQAGSVEAVRMRESVRLRLEDTSEEVLLHRFLEEFLYYKDAERLLLRATSVRILEERGRFALEATAEGERIDSARRELGTDVKAVTWHLFSLERAGGGYAAVVVLDV